MSGDLDAYWANYDKCLDEISDFGATVDDVIRILLKYWPPSACEAFFPGGGDRGLVGVLLWHRSDWAVRWLEADYYCCLVDRHGGLLSYIEGDVERGDCKLQGAHTAKAPNAETKPPPEVEPWHGKAGEEQRQ